MSTYFVDWKELEAKAGELETYNATLRTQTDSYVQNANSLKSSFDGDVADDFYTEVANHKAKIDAFIQVIDKYVAAMRTMASDVKAKEVQAQQVVGQKNY